ncbi:hypothetical protein [Sorangium sp. So ce693]|uniref:hypothetical protein n=1 Tax=Sorangium sp. So ce693 TaxID=3133318 RepID=UPI003F63C1D0
MPLEVTTAASRLLQDEARHTELCARAAEALGGNHGATLAPSDLQLPRNGLPAHLFVARWTASMFCVGESASVGILDVLQQHTTDPCLADGGPLPDAPPPSGPNLGIPSRPAAARAFYERIDRVILPSLAALGVPAYEAWALRLEVPAQAENR